MDNDSVSNDDNPTKQAVPLIHLLLALLCPIIAILLSYLMKINIEKKIFTVISRMIVQLLFAGYFLLSYLFTTTSPYVIIVYLLGITIVAAFEASGRRERTYPGHFNDSVISLLFGGTFLGLLFSIMAFDPDPWWDPKVIVTTVGMLLGNAISGPSIAVDRYLSLITDQKFMVDTRLSFGSTGYEAVLPFVRQSITASFLPILNRMSVVGIVSIPGIMAGQLLGGATPLVAAEYQMIIFWILCGTATFTIYISIFFAIFHGTIDKFHRLTMHRIIKLDKLKESLYMLIYEKSIHIINKIKLLFHSLSHCDTQSIRNQSAVYEIVSIGDESTHHTDLESNKLDRNYCVNYSILSNNSLNNATSDVILSMEFVNLIVNDIPLFDPKNCLKLTLRQGERISIEGPSGIGKTRLLRVISKLDSCLSGEFNLNKQVISDLNTNCVIRVKNNIMYQLLCKQWSRCLEYITSCDFNIDIPIYRRHVMYIPQALPPMTQSPKAFLLDCLDFECRRNLPCYTDIKENIDKLCKDMEVKLGLLDGKLSQEWSSLSGGERQRAIIGCGLILSSNLNQKSDKNYPPLILLLDEPTAACDNISCQLVEQAIIDSNVTVILITHDSSQSIRLCHRRLVLSLAK